MSKLQDNIIAVNLLNNQMHTDITEFLKQHNRLVRTDNAERKNKGLPLCDTIYTISMDAGNEPPTEKEVLAVYLDDDEQVCVLPNMNGHETISGMSDQEVIDCDNWEWIYGGYTLKNATLTSICECIEKYV